MRDRFIYENHLGRRFDEDCVYLNHSDLRDYSWSYDTMNGRISRLYRSIRPRKLPLVIVGKTGDEATEIKNRLFEIAEADIMAMIPGKIYSGEYYTQGYITDSAKSKYMLNKRFSKIDLTLTSEDPAWYREQLHPFAVGDEARNATSGTDYPYAYPYDYAVSLTTRTIVCNSAGSNPFKLLIYGSAVNPTVNIGGHVYTINGTIGARETLLIDSLTKKITLTTATGEKVNWFDKRNRENYIFQPIPAGQNTVNWNGSFGFDLTIIEKRSEPKWT